MTFNVRKNPLNTVRQRRRPFRGVHQDQVMRDRGLKARHHHRTRAGRRDHQQPARRLRQKRIFRDAHLPRELVTPAEKPRRLTKSSGGNPYRKGAKVGVALDDPPTVRGPNQRCAFGPDRRPVLEANTGRALRKKHLMKLVRVSARHRASGSAKASDNQPGTTRCIENHNRDVERGVASVNAASAPSGAG